MPLDRRVAAKRKVWAGRSESNVFPMRRSHYQPRTISQNPITKTLLFPRLEEARQGGSSERRWDCSCERQRAGDQFQIHLLALVATGDIHLLALMATKRRRFPRSNGANGGN